MAEWISIEDRLPELDEDVLIYAIGKSKDFLGDSVIAISCQYEFKCFPWSKSGTIIWCSPFEYFDTNYEVTHWMPLPNPPC